jgi:hypothetical protein
MLTALGQLGSQAPRLAWGHTSTALQALMLLRPVREAGAAGGLEDPGEQCHSCSCPSGPIPCTLGHSWRTKDSLGEQKVEAEREARLCILLALQLAGFPL